MYTHGVWRIIDSFNLKHVLVLLQNAGVWQLTLGTRDEGHPQPGIHRYYEILIGHAQSEAAAVCAVNDYIKRIWVTNPETLIVGTDAQPPALVIQQYFEIRSDKAAVIQSKMELIESIHFGSIEYKKI